MADGTKEEGPKDGVMGMIMKAKLPGEPKMLPITGMMLQLSNDPPEQTYPTQLSALSGHPPIRGKKLIHGF